MSTGNVDILSNPFGLLPSSREIFEAFLDVPVSTFSIILGIIFWLFLLYFPLSAIDRRDRIAGLTYAMFMCFSGTVLIIVLAGTDNGLSGIFTNLLVCIVMYGAAKLRWMNRTQKAFTEISTEEASS
jgi:hypothetical protein